MALDFDLDWRRHRATVAERRAAAGRVGAERRWSPRPLDLALADAPERHKPLRMQVVLRYQIPSTKARARGEQTSVREDVHVRRVVNLTLNADSLLAGPREIAVQLARKVFAQLSQEGFPVQTRFPEEPELVRL